MKVEHRPAGTVVLDCEGPQGVVAPPLRESDLMVGCQCPICGYPVLAGEPIAAVALGPDSKDDAEAIARGEPYTATGVVLHARCAAHRISAHG